MIRGLLVGATGILGSNLLMTPSKVDWTPTYFSPPAMRYPKAVELDLRNHDSVISLVEVTQPEIIVHVAGLTKPDSCETDPGLSYGVNVEGSDHLIVAAKMVNARFIFLSSDLVFDGEKRSPYTEEDVVNPFTVYGKHKVFVEELIQSKLTNYLIIRTSIMYGWTPAYLSSIAEWIIERLEQCEFIEMFADQYRNMTFVGDMVKFINTKLVSKVTGIVHMASPDCVSKAHFARELSRGFGYDPALIRDSVSTAIDRAAVVPAHLALDISKAVDQFGANPNNLEGGVTAMHHQLLAGYPERFNQWIH